MTPGNTILDKFLQERTAGNGSCLHGCPNILHICYLRSNLMTIIIPEGQFPYLFSCSPRRSFHFFDQFFIRTHNTCRYVSQGYNNCTSKCCEIKDVFRFIVFAGIGQCISEDQSTFRIGVKHFNSLIVIGFQNITGFIGLCSA